MQWSSGLLLLILWMLILQLLLLLLLLVPLLLSKLLLLITISQKYDCYSLLILLELLLLCLWLQLILLLLTLLSTAFTTSQGNTAPILETSDTDSASTHELAELPVCHESAASAHDLCICLEDCVFGYWKQPTCGRRGPGNSAAWLKRNDFQKIRQVFLFVPVSDGSQSCTRDLNSMFPGALDW